MASEREVYSILGEARNGKGGWPAIDCISILGHVYER
jgi:hypothetical protein